MSVGAGKRCRAVLLEAASRTVRAKRPVSDPCPFSGQRHAGDLPARRRLDRGRPVDGGKLLDQAAELGQGEAPVRRTA